MLYISCKENFKTISSKNHSFTSYEFVFITINDFLDKYNRGYLTIVGSPGSGKSVILAQFASYNYNPDIKIIYYNAQIEGKNTAEDFLKYACSQLSRKKEEIPDNATEGSCFLSLLLQQISDKLAPNQKLIIAIDALDTINPNNQSLGTNLLYLPRYLPQGIYFLLTRRPFKKEKSGLLIEAPSQILDLSQHNLKNWDNDLAFTQHWQQMQGEGFSDIAMKILQVLATAGNEGISASTILQRIYLTNPPTLDADIFDVEEVLENWFEFLQQHQVNNEIRYSLYHPNFRDWLAEKLS
jgi:ABC-type dipeptide/oligopeptide/nickel transport system ATPase component